MALKGRHKRREGRTAIEHCSSRTSQLADGGTQKDASLRILDHIARVKEDVGTTRDIPHKESISVSGRSVAAANVLATRNMADIGLVQAIRRLQC